MSAEVTGSSADPSRARAASPALLSMSSAIRESMVCAAMIRHAVTGCSWPMRWIRSMAWVCSAAVQDSSASTRLEATCRLIPTPAAVREHTATATSGSLVNASMFAWRTLVVWSPRIDAYPIPRWANSSSARSITSTCLAKKTTLPTLRASWAV